MRPAEGQNGSRGRSPNSSASPSNWQESNWAVLREILRWPVIAARRFSAVLLCRPGLKSGGVARPPGNKDHFLNRRARRGPRVDERCVEQADHRKPDGIELWSHERLFTLRGLTAEAQVPRQHVRCKDLLGATVFHRLRPSNGIRLRVERSTLSRQRTLTAAVAAPDGSTPKPKGAHPQSEQKWCLMTCLLKV